MLDHREYEALRKRMGDALFRARMAEQTYHLAGSSHQSGVFLVLERFFDVDRTVVFLTKLFGIYWLGHRNFKDVRVVENPVYHPRLPAAFEGFRVLQLSDLHLDLDRSLRPVIVERLQGLSYELAVITGDFRNTTDSPHGPSVEEVSALLPSLKEPVYAVLGNHDFIEIVPPLERAGLRFLLNEVVTIKRKGASIFLAGTDDANFYGTHDLVRVKDAIDGDAFSILLSHSPEIFRQASSHGFDVMFSGHTHGGQLCLPGGVVLTKLADVPRALLSGAWRFRNLVGYTSPGTGSCGVPLRFFCPPEITVHVLHQGPPVQPDSDPISPSERRPRVGVRLV